MLPGSVAMMVVDNDMADCLPVVEEGSHGPANHQLVSGLVGFTHLTLSLSQMSKSDSVAPSLLRKLLHIF